MQHCVFWVNPGPSERDANEIPQGGGAEPMLEIIWALRELYFYSKQMSDVEIKWSAISLFSIAGICMNNILDGHTYG